MAQLQSTCVIGTLSISASNAASQQSIMIGGGCNNAEFTNQCNIVAIGENTALTGSGALNPTSLTTTQEGGGFCNNYNYYARFQGCHKPFTLSGGGGGTGFDFDPFVPIYGYYGDPCKMPVFVYDSAITNLGSGYTSTVTATIYDPSTTSETCEIFTIDPFQNEDVINIGHNAGCRAQGNNTIRIGSSAGKGNLTNGFCYQINSIAIGKNTMLSGSFEDNVVVGHNSFTGNNTCADINRMSAYNTIVGNNNFPSATQRVYCTTVIGNNNLPSVPCSTANIVIGDKNVLTVGTNKEMCSSNIVLGCSIMCCSASGNQNIFLGQNVARYGCLNSSNNNIGIGYVSLSRLTTGDFNTSIGYYAGCCNTSGTHNVYIGSYTGFRHTTGVSSVFIGCAAGCGTCSQSNSIFIGPGTGRYGSSCQGGHVVMGTEALRNMTSGYFNTAIGHCALSVGGQTSTSCGLSGCGYNIAIGPYAGRYNKTSSEKNIYIGHAMGPSSLATESCKFCLGMDSGNTLLVGCLNSGGRTLGICGTLSKTAGSFQISHPDPIKTEAKDLWHSFVESPTAGDNLYRFKVEVENGQAIIDLPDYYKHLNENDQVWVNAKNHFGRAYGVVNQEQTTLTVFADTDGEYNILLIGTRKDKDAVNAWKGTERLKEN